MSTEAPIAPESLSPILKLQILGGAIIGLRNELISQTVEA